MSDRVTMNPVDNALMELGHQLDGIGARDRDYVVFGSSVMYLHRLREDVGDVDVFVSRRVWGRLLAAENWSVLTPRAGDPPLLELPARGVHHEDRRPIHAFYDWTARDEWLSVARCFELAEKVKGFMCIPLAEVARQKHEAWAANPDDPTHEKHRADLALLSRHVA